MATYQTIALPTKYGKFEVFSTEVGGQECVVALNKSYEGVPFVRLHSSCLFSEAFHSNDCDCAIQLDASLDYVGKNGGLVIYLYQEGRGIGIQEKIKAINIEQKKGVNTASAFEILGHESDPRSYEVAISVLSELGISEIALGTNNPNKIRILEESGISVVERIQLEITPNEVTKSYIDRKVEALGHHENS